MNNKTAAISVKIKAGRMKTQVLGRAEVNIDKQFTASRKSKTHRISSDNLTYSLMQAREDLNKQNVAAVNA